MKRPKHLPPHVLRAYEIQEGCKGGLYTEVASHYESGSSVKWLMDWKVHEGTVLGQGNVTNPLAMRVKDAVSGCSCWINLYRNTPVLTKDLKPVGPPSHQVFQFALPERVERARLQMVRADRMLRLTILEAYPVNYLIKWIKNGQVMEGVVLDHAGKETPSILVKNTRTGSSYWIRPKTALPQRIKPSDRYRPPPF